MTDKTDKSIQELREEIQRLENENKALRKNRSENLEKENSDLTARLCELQNVAASLASKHCVGVHYGDIRGALVELERLYEAARDDRERNYREVWKAREEIRGLKSSLENLTNQPEVIAGLKEERDANMMRALDAERKARDLMHRLSQLEDVGLLKKAEAAAAEAVRTRDIATNGNAKLQTDLVNLRYALREREKELEELKARHAELQARNVDREWAAENKNAYDSLLALRDILAPTVPLQDACIAIQAVVNSLKMEVERCREGIAIQATKLQEAEQEAKKEKSLKAELYVLYAELRSLFDLGHIPSALPQKVHSAIKHMLDTRSDEIQRLSEQLVKERTLACEEIRRLQEELGLAKS